MAKEEFPAAVSAMVMTSSDWKLIYKVGAIAALIILPVGILDLVLTFLPGGATPDPGKGSVKDWFLLFDKDTFLGLRGLGMFNVLNAVLGIPVFIALYGAHRRLSKPIAMMAMIVFILGAGIYIANNPAFAMQTLSNKYYAATTDYQRSLLTAAGEALLAGSEDFTPGSFTGLFLIQLAGLLISFVMLLNRRFDAITGWLGFGGFAGMLIFILWASFIPVFFTTALVFGIIGGLLTLSWHVMVAQRLFKL
jgi:hypothetical protein